MRDITVLDSSAQHHVVIFLVLGLLFSSGCTLNMNHNKIERTPPDFDSVFHAEGILVISNHPNHPDSLVIRVQNVSKEKIWVFNEIAAVLVPYEHEEDELNMVHFDFGVDPHAHYVPVQSGEWIEFQVLLGASMEQRLLRFMRGHVPITMMLRADGEENAVLLGFEVRDPNGLKSKQSE